MFKVNSVGHTLPLSFSYLNTDQPRGLGGDKVTARLLFVAALLVKGDAFGVITLPTLLALPSPPALPRPCPPDFSFPHIHFGHVPGCCVE